MFSISVLTVANRSQCSHRMCDHGHCSFLSISHHLGDHWANIVVCCGTGFSNINMELKGKRKKLIEYYKVDIFTQFSDFLQAEENLNCTQPRQWSFNFNVQFIVCTITPFTHLIISLQVVFATFQSIPLMFCPITTLSIEKRSINNFLKGWKDLASNIIVKYHVRYKEW